MWLSQLCYNRLVYVWANCGAKTDYWKDVILYLEKRNAGKNIEKLD